MSKTPRKGKRPTRGQRTPPASGRKASYRLAARDVTRSANELVAYHRLFAHVVQRQEQERWALFYLCGQLSNLVRKTIEPMVLELYGTDLNAVRALQHFIGQAHWSAEAMIRQCQALVHEWLGDPAAVMVVDGSGFPKQGDDSVGVAHQYCGHLGKVANCQEGVFLVYVSPKGYAFVDERLYVHASWFAEDHRERWQQCGIPDDLVFQTEPALGLEMLRRLAALTILPFRWVAADERFGQNTGFLDGVDALGKLYLIEVPSNTRAWKRRPRVEPPGPGLLGHVRTRPRLAASAPPARELREWIREIPRSAWHKRVIKTGSQGPMVAEFAFLRMTMVRDALPGPRQWVVFRRSLSDPPEVKYYASNAPATCPTSEFVRLSGLRWPVETTFKEGKGEVGMDHYETRTWLGWHHHMAHSFRAHLFLIRLRLLFEKKAPRLPPLKRANSWPRRFMTSNRPWIPLPL